MPRIIDLNIMGNEKTGYLSFFESLKDVNFKIKRIYYIYDVPLDKKRGMHAHKQLEQLIWCPYGNIEIILDNGIKKKKFVLDKPYKALIVERGFWRDMFWKKKGSVLCVAASDYYTEDDYIRNYSEFKKLVEEEYWSNENKF